MPPKKPPETSKKTEIKKKEKIVEDKTFGLKNKKGSKQQKFIQQVQQQVVHSGKTAKQLDKERAEKLAKKDEKKKVAEELNVLFRPVEQKVSKGTDPKSVLCAFYKVGQCMKGDKCKFSHDVSIGRKSEKRSVYEDHRRATEDETMADWDEEKLEEVVKQKHGDGDHRRPKTDIICKYFLEAVETSKYGWFWECPNGDTCFYRHALPPGFVLKKDQKREEVHDQISLEELIERERAALTSHNLTKVTLESFLLWKEQKRMEKSEKAHDDALKKKADFSAGKMFGISGREMFEFDPNLVENDDDEADDSAYHQFPEDDDCCFSKGTVREVSSVTFMHRFNGDTNLLIYTTNGTSESRELDGTPAVCSELAGSDNAGACAAVSDTGNIRDTNDDIDENLFDGDDLEFVENHLDSLAVVE